MQASITTPLKAFSHCKYFSDNFELNLVLFKVFCDHISNVAALNTEY